MNSASTILPLSQGTPVSQSAGQARHEGDIFRAIGANVIDPRGGTPNVRPRASSPISTLTSISRSAQAVTRQAACTLGPVVMTTLVGPASASPLGPTTNGSPSPLNSQASASASKLHPRSNERRGWDPHKTAALVICLLGVAALALIATSAYLLRRSPRTDDRQGDGSSLRPPEEGAASVKRPDPIASPNKLVRASRQPQEPSEEIEMDLFAMGASGVAPQAASISQERLV
jgi:hypothetical protein